MASCQTLPPAGQWQLLHQFTVLNKSSDSKWIYFFNYGQNNSDVTPGAQMILFTTCGDEKLQDCHYMTHISTPQITNYTTIKTLKSDRCLYC